MNLAQRILRPIFLDNIGKYTKLSCSAAVRTPLFGDKTLLSPPSSRPPYISLRFSSTMPSNEGPNVVQHTPKVLVIGCSYAGLATTVNLLDLCDGKPPRFSGTLSEDTAPTPKLPVDITIVDERDGYCMSLCIRKKSLQSLNYTFRSLDWKPVSVCLRGSRFQKLDQISGYPCSATTQRTLYTRQCSQRRL